MFLMLQEEVALFDSTAGNNNTALKQLQSTKLHKTVTDISSLSFRPWKRAFVPLQPLKSETFCNSEENYIQCCDTLFKNLSTQSCDVTFVIYEYNNSREKSNEYEIDREITMLNCS